MDARYKYGYAQDWSKWPDCEVSIKNIKEKQERVSFYREKSSHKGISKFKNIKELLAEQVNQNFLLEISELSAIEYLSIEITTAEDLSPLVQLPNLRFLKLDSVLKAKDFSAIVNHKPVECLFIQNANHLDT